MTFHPGASINQRLATVAPFLTPWRLGCRDGGDDGDDDNDDDDGDDNATIMIMTLLDCQMNKEKSGNGSKKLQTRLVCTSYAACAVRLVLVLLLLVQVRVLSALVYLLRCSL